MKKDFDLIAKWVQGLLKFEAQPPHNFKDFDRIRGPLQGSDVGCKF